MARPTRNTERVSWRVGPFYVAGGQPPGDGANARGVLASPCVDVADQAALASGHGPALLSRAPRGVDPGARRRQRPLDGAPHLGAPRPRIPSRPRCSTPTTPSRRISRGLANTRSSCSTIWTPCLPESFDYVVGTAILCHDRYAENLRHIHRLLKPGGQMLFFEANYWNPQVLAKSVVPAVGPGRETRAVRSACGKFRLMKAASHQGFTDIEVVPYDIVHARTPRRLIRPSRRRRSSSSTSLRPRGLWHALRLGKQAQRRDTVAAASTSPTTPDSMDRPRSSCPAATRR